MRRFIVYWDYRRKDQLLPFEKLSNDYEWYYIYFRYREDDPVASLENRVYWSDYASPYALLLAIKPDGIIFSDLSSSYAIALNIAGKNKGIRTFLLEHGIKLDYDYYLTAEANNKFYLRNPAKPPESKGEKVNSLLFYLRSFKLKNLKFLYKFIRLPLQLALIKSDKAFVYSKFSLRCPDLYLLFSRQNFSYYQYRDGISPDSVIYFGNPYLDDFIQELDTANHREDIPYYLLLDDGQIEIFGITAAQKNEFFRKLNEFCRNKGSRLLIKLHPFDYGRKDLYQHENITYFESANIAELIGGAAGCFAISTSLMFPLIIAGRAIIFKVAGSTVQDVLAEFGVRFLDYLNFSPDDIDFSAFQIKNEVREAFIEQFLYKNDGKALDRLKKILDFSQ
jgi:hypothetical protein